MEVTIIGGGLAGSEAAWQLVSRGYRVQILEMRPVVMTKAHKTGKFAELVCSNSFRGGDLSHAVGLLKEELRRLGSLVMHAADLARVPAGAALAVDRALFSDAVDASLRRHPLVTVREVEVTEIPDASESAPVIIATGPLTAPRLSKAIADVIGGGHLAFYDAISPIILHESIDESRMFRQSRYGKGEGDDYLNIPLTREEYYRFVDEVARGEKFRGHEDVESDCIEGVRPFEGCMPIEDMVERGPDTLLFGPMKPVGLCDPKTNERPYAVIQLRQDDKAGSLWSMVGFQTRLKQGEQLRIFKMLPGLENAEFIRLGTVHRNTFLNSPKCLAPTLELRSRKGVFFAGQVTGVEGYVESTAGGMVAGINVARLLSGKSPLVFPPETAIGALLAYISEPDRKDFQPMNINYGIVAGYTEQMSAGKRGKKDRRIAVAEHALKILGDLMEREQLGDALPGLSALAPASLSVGESR